MGVGPWSFGEVAEPRRLAGSHGRRFRIGLGHEGVALAAGVVDAARGDGPEREAGGAATGLSKEDEARGAGGAHPHPEAGEAGVPYRVLALAGAKPGDARIGEAHAFLSGHGSFPPEHRTDGLDGVAHHRIGEVDVLERRRRSGVSEQPGDGEHALALAQGEGGVGMSQVMQAHVVEVRLGADPMPHIAKPRRADRATAISCREDPCAGALDGVEDTARGARQPHRPRSGLRIAQEQPVLAVVGPAKREHLALAASGEQQQPDRGHLKHPLGLVRRERGPEAANLRVGEIALAPLAPVASDPPARIGALGAKPHALGLCEDDRHDGQGAVGGDGGGPKRGEPALHVGAGDVGNGHAGEPGQNLSAQVDAVDVQCPRFPHSGMMPEHGFGDGLEARARRHGRIGIAANGGHQRGGPRPRLVDGHGAGIADHLPCALTLMLGVDEEALCARGRYAHAEAPELRVAQLVGAAARTECPDAGVGEGEVRHRRFSCGQLQPGNRSLGGSLPHGDFDRRTRRRISQLAPQVRRTVYEWAVHEWAVRRARRDGLVLEEVDMEGTYFRSRIGENMRRATRAWFAEGVEEGLRRGREQGVEQQRALLVRQITTKFGAVAAQRVGPLLDRVAAPALLAEVGDALLVCATETELVARVEAVIASMAPSADTDPSSGH